MLPAETHLLAAALLCYADDEGYFNANPVLLKAGTVPLRTDKTPIEQQLQQLQEMGYLEIRRSGVRSFGRILTFNTHQRVYHPTASKFRDRFEELPKFSGEDPESLGPERNREQGKEQGTGNREASTATGAVSASPPFIALPLLRGEHIVTEADVAEWQEAYPGIDVPAELRRVCVWLKGNPQKLSKTIPGSIQRLIRWFNWEQDRGGRNGARNHAIPGKTGHSLDAAQQAIEFLRQREASADRADVGQAGDSAAGQARNGGLLGSSRGPGEV